MLEFVQKTKMMNETMCGMRKEGLLDFYWCDSKGLYPQMIITDLESLPKRMVTAGSLTEQKKNFTLRQESPELQKHTVWLCYKLNWQLNKILIFFFFLVCCKLILLKILKILSQTVCQLKQLIFKQQINSLCV